MNSSLDAFDLNAAVLRHSERDMRAFMAALAVRLETALPGRVSVERKRDGFFSSTSHVAEIRVEHPDAVFTLSFGKPGLTASRAKVVRGVTIGTSTLPVPQWLAELNKSVADLADRSAIAGDVLHGFL
jgi:hypothetical protein